MRLRDLRGLSPQHLLATLYKGWHADPPRLRTLVPKYILPWAVLGAFILILVLVGHWLLDPPLSGFLTWLAAGLFAGAIMRDVAWAKRFVAQWPALRSLLDWQKVEDALNAPKPDPSVAVEQPPVRARRSVIAAIVIGCAVLVLAFVIDQVLLRHYTPPPPATDAVVIYTTAWCPYCEQLRVHLRRSRIPYQELDVEKSREGYYAHRALGGHGVPVTVIGNKTIHGLQRDQLDESLRAAGYTPAAWD